MASQAELGILLSAKDTASAALHAFAGVVASSLVGALSDAANAAADDEASVLALKQAVENSGSSYDDYAGSLGEAIKKGQDLAYTDDQTRAALQMLTEETGSVDEAMKRLPATMDLARAKHVDLEVAAKLLGKVSDENTKGLKKLGIVMEAGATATDVLAKVQQVAGGQAEAYGSSTKGMIDKTKDAFAEWKESIGTAMGPAMGIVAMLPGMSQNFLMVGGAVGMLSKAVKSEMITSFLASIPATLAMMAPFIPLMVAIGAIILVVALLAVAWKNNFLDIQGKTKVAIDFILDVFDGLHIAALLIWRAILTGIAGVINGVIGVINGFIKAYDGVAEKLGLPLIGTIDLVTPNLAQIDADINKVAADRNARIHVTYDAPPMPPSANYRGPYASGTDHITQGPELFLAGEAGAERVTVTPLAGGIGNRGGGGSGLTVNVNINGDVYDAVRFEDRVRAAVLDGIRSGGFRGSIKLA